MSEIRITAEGRLGRMQLGVQRVSLNVDIHNMVVQSQFTEVL